MSEANDRVIALLESRIDDIEDLCHLIGRSPQLETRSAMEAQQKLRDLLDQLKRDQEQNPETGEQSEDENAAAAKTFLKPAAGDALAELDVNPNSLPGLSWRDKLDRARDHLRYRLDQIVARTPS